MNNLKYILLASFFVLITAITDSIKAQGNLQFNRVVTFKPGDNYIIPTGKCLKIESVNFGSNVVIVPKTGVGQCYSCGPNPFNFGVYGPMIYLTLGDSNFSTSAFDGNNSNCCLSYNTSTRATTFTLSISCPIWLEAGKNVIVNSGVSNLIVSAIEYNIIP